MKPSQNQKVCKVPRNRRNFVTDFKLLPDPFAVL